MARSSADDVQLRKCCELAIATSVGGGGGGGGGGGKQDVVLSIRVAKSRGGWGKGPRLGRQANPRVICITTKSKGQKIKPFLRVLKDTGGGILEPLKLYKLKHLSKMEVLQSDPSGCTFSLGFGNQSAQPQWTMTNSDDRNRVLICILNLCKEHLGRFPKVVGVDIVEMALWAKTTQQPSRYQEYTPPAKGTTQGGPDPSDMLQSGTQVAVEGDLVSQAEEEDMEALLGTYVMGIGEAEEFSERLKRELLALEAANVHSLLESEPIVDEVLQGLEIASICVDDMDEWLCIFNVKLRHMREDIESIESRNNKLELQSVSSKALIEELDKIVELFCIPPKYWEALTGGPFDENSMPDNIEACEWLTGALHNLEVSRLDPCYAKMKGMKEKRAELLLIKCTFVGRASEFLRNYFPNLVDLMINDKSCFSQRGQLKRPEHADLRYKCRTYARLLLHIKNLDKNCMAPLRKAYCHSLNLLLRREAREFANELRAGAKIPKTPIITLDGAISASQPSSETATISEAYSKMLTVFIPLLVDESAFFAHFMCFDIVSHPPSDASAGIDSATANAEGKMASQGMDPAELGILSECLKDLIAGLEEDFFSIVDWAFKIDPLCCISMHEITERYLSAQKAETAGFVHLLLDDLDTRITMLFGKFIDDACYQIEKTGERNVRQIGVLPFIPRFAVLASRMEQYIQGQSRDLIDQAYMKLVSVMFVVLERTAQVDPKYIDVVLLENYAAFQNSLYELANVVPTLAKFYHQASDSYEQACLRHVSMVIYVHFEKLFQFARKIEELMFNISPEEIPFAVGMSKADLRKMLKSSLSGLDKIINSMYRKLQKNITSEELLPSLWDKCKKEFLEKYGSFVELVNRIYPNEPIPTVQEMKDALTST